MELIGTAILLGLVLAVVALLAGQIKSDDKSRVTPASDSARGRTSKKTVSPEYLGESLGDQIFKEVFQPQTPLPSSYNTTEWLLTKAFGSTIVVPQVFSKIHADRILKALHDKAWSAALGIGSRQVTQADLHAFNERATLRYRQYENAMNLFVRERNEKPMMNALLQNVSPGGGLDEMLNLWFAFNASMKAQREILVDISSRFEVLG
jgi:hypothetical protein